MIFKNIRILKDFKEFSPVSCFSSCALSSALESENSKFGKYLRNWWLLSRLDHENHNYDCGDNISAIVDDCKDLPEAEEEGGDTDEDDAEVEEHDELAKMMVIIVMMMTMTKNYEF